MTATATGTRPEIRLPSGVAVPDWSAVTSDTAGEALAAILGAFGAMDRWTGIGAAEDRVRRAVLNLYARLGHAPAIGQVAGAASVTPDQGRALVRKLKARDLVVLDETGERIVGAYPFRDHATGHRVRLGVRLLNAMCAIDALGVGAMYGQDVAIESACPACGRAIHIRTRDEGTAIDEASPPETVVWAGIQYADACAADSLCTVLAFFCSDAHLQSWRRSEQPDGEGFRLSLDEGLQAGSAIFGPMLAGGSGRGPSAAAGRP